MNSEYISKAVASLLPADTATIGLLYVTDTLPHDEMERRRERALRPRHTGPLRNERLRQAEQYAVQDILEEGKRSFPNAETLHREGRPEREIVQLAAEWYADVIVICPRAPTWDGPRMGPKSVGHVARFVLDHAPCLVLLVRPLSSE